MNSKYKLKPCPFCGGKAHVVDGMLSLTSLAVCDKCGAAVTFYGNEAEREVIEAWNKRVSDDE